MNHEKGKNYWEEIKGTKQRYVMGRGKLVL